jgi:hypothetical protein
MTLVRVPLDGGRTIAACRAHFLPTRRGAMAHSIDTARLLAAGWINARTSRDNSAAVFACGVLYDKPDCCPSAQLAQSMMMAAFRELTAGEADG